MSHLIGLDNREGAMNKMEEPGAAVSTTAQVPEVSKFAGDELALKTQWHPASRLAANFCSHRLVGTPGGEGWRFAACGLTRVIPVVFGVGLTAGAVIFLSGIIPPSRSLLAALPWLYVAVPLIVIAVLVAGGYIYRTQLAPYIVFDLGQKCYFCSVRDPRKIVDLSQLPGYVHFREIGALQLLEKQVKGSRNHPGYLAYELNIVLRDGRRVNVIAHGDYRQLAADAATLSRSLQVPLWDVTPGADGRED